MKLPSLSRRKLLTLLAISVAAPTVTIQEATALLRGGGKTGGSVFNAGKWQTNLNFDQIGGDYPYVNLLKGAQQFGAADNSGAVPSDELNANGYPIPGTNVMTSRGGISSVFFSPTVQNAGAYRVANVTGKGTVAIAGPITTTATQASPITILSIAGGTSSTVITFSGAHLFKAGQETVPASVTGTIAGSLNGNKFVIVSVTTNTITITTAGLNGLTGSGGNASYGSLTVGVATGGRIIYDISGIVPGGPGSATGGSTSEVFQIQATDATTPISDVAICLLADEPTWVTDPYAPFPKLVAQLIIDRPGVIRALNKTNTNGSNVVNWAGRKPLSYICYAGGEMRASIFGGTTTSVLDDYAITKGSGAPTHLQQITLEYDAPAVTVSVSGSAAVITWPGAHNMIVGQQFQLYTVFGGSAPLDTQGSPQPLPLGYRQNYFVLSTPTGSTMTFSLTLGGAAVTTSSTGSSVRAHIIHIEQAVTVSSGSSTITTSVPHLLSVNEPVMWNDSVAPFVKSGKVYYVRNVLSGTTLNLSATPGGSVITATANGSSYLIRVKTLSLNGTTAIPIADRFSTPYTTGGNSIPAYSWFGTGKQYATLTFDSRLNGGAGLWMNQGASVEGSCGIINYAPPEYIFALCKAVGAHPYFTSPPYTMDDVSAGCYTDGLATLGKTYAAANATWMIPRYEGINECWNGQFMGTVYTIALGWAFWGVEDLYQSYGRSASLMGQCINKAYGSPAVGAGYKFFIGVQTATTLRSDDTVNINGPKFTSATFVASGPTPPAGYTQSAAYNWTTAAVDAQYFTYSKYFTWYEQFLSSSVCQFTASVNTSGVMTVTAIAQGALAAGQMVGMGSINWQTTITSQLTGSAGGTGTYQLSLSPARAVPSDKGFAVQPSVAAALLDTLAGHRFTGSVSGTTLTVTAMTDNYSVVRNGEPLVFPGVVIDCDISSQVSGTSFTGTIAGNVLTVSGLASGQILGYDQGIQYSGSPGGLQIIALGTGTGGNGTYILSSSPGNVGPITMSNLGGPGVYNLRSTSQTAASQAMASGTFIPIGLSRCFSNLWNYAQTLTNNAGNKLGLEGYEGGNSPDFLGFTINGTSAEPVNALRNFTKYVTSSPLKTNGMKDWAMDVMTRFTAVGGLFYSYYLYTGTDSAQYAWSIKDDLYQTPNSPQLQAAIAMN